MPKPIFGNRLYSIQWVWMSLGGKTERRGEIFQWDERQAALERYMYLQDQWYASDIIFQIAEPQTLSHEQVQQLINAY
jgi:hypothetical protein